MTKNKYFICMVPLATNYGDEQNSGLPQHLVLLHPPQRTSSGRNLIYTVV